MAQHWSRIFLHFAWATRQRAPIIEPELEPYLYEVIASQCVAFDCTALAIGGTRDHVHALVRMHVTASVAPLVRQMKSKSSQAVTLNVPGMESFSWQAGYGVVSVGRRHVPDVMRYVLDQRERHHTGRLTPALEITEYQSVDDGFEPLANPQRPRPER